MYMMTQASRDQWRQKLVDQDKELHRLRELVYKDELTGLLNYRAFRDDMGHRLDASEAFALLYLDLNRFKEVNDHFGHLAGDRILKEVGSVLGKAAGQGARVYRLGGDEFALIMETAKDMDIIHDRVFLGIEQAAGLNIGALQIRASIGYATCPEDGRTYEELLGFADCRMYAAKQRAREQN